MSQMSKHVTSKTEHDRRVIETVVRRFGPLSRVEIHELTHLQQSVISRLVRELLDEGILVEAGRANNSMGRKQVLLRLNEEAGFILGIGFNAEQVIASTMNLRPAAKSIIREVTRLGHGREGLIDQLLDCAKRAIRQAGVDVGSLLGIGLAGSGLVDSREGIFVMSSTLDCLNGAPLKKIFEQEFGVPTLVENITRAKTVAERVLGAGEMQDDMIYLEYGTGIGAGIFTDGKLLYGSGYAAGELGHIQVEDGPACKCGSFGCLEAVAGGWAIEAKIRNAIAEGCYTEALNLGGGDVNQITEWTVLEAAQRGDKTCVFLVEQLGNYLGLGLANLVNLFNPARLVLDQRLSLAGEGLLQQITRVIRRQALAHSTKQLVVRLGKLGSEASALGVALMLLDKRFEIPALKPPRFMIESVQAPPRRALAEPAERPGSPSPLPR